MRANLAAPAGHGERGGSEKACLRQEPARPHLATRDLVADPPKAATPEVGFRTAGLYWQKNGLNDLADVATPEAFREITKRINGGLNGLKDREKFYATARTVLGVVTPPPTPGPESLPPVQPLPFERGFEAIRADARRRRSR